MGKKKENLFSKINFDLDYRTAHPIWRIFAGILGLLLVSMAIVEFINFLVNKDPISMAPFAWLGGGIVFLIIAWRGHLLRD